MANILREFWAFPAVVLHRLLTAFLCKVTSLAFRPSEDSPDVGDCSHASRLRRLKERLASKAVQAALPGDLAEEPVRLTEAQVEQIFVDLVPGVKKFLYRQQHGVYALSFIKTVYREGWAAFRGTDLEGALLSSIRLVIHHAFDGKPNAALYLRQVAEAFMDCQAVQARVIERIGLQLRGVSKDFQGQMAVLVGEYKLMAARMLAYEDMAKRGDPNGHRDPNHYENRLIMEIGDKVGLSHVDLRRASLDEHGKRRFRPFTRQERDAAVGRFLVLFEVEALLKAFAAEAGSFGEASEADSLPRQFLDWATHRLSNSHVVLDAETCTRVEVGDGLALAVFEDLFLKGIRCAPDERYRGELMLELFRTEARVPMQPARGAQDGGSAPLPLPSGPGLTPA